MGKEKSSGKLKNLKKVSNILWFVGTISALLFIAIAVIIIAYTNYKDGVKDDILANLSRYNAVHYGYTPESEDISGNNTVVADVPEELIAVLDTIEADSTDILDTYNQVSVRVKEPVEDVDIVVSKLSDYTDYWQIVKEGIVYHGTPNYVTTAEAELKVVLSEADNVDVFLTNFDNAIINNTESMVLYGDVNFGKLVLTDTLCSSIKPTIEGTDDVASLMLKLQLLSELGEYTPAMNNLYNLYSQIQ